MWHDSVCNTVQKPTATSIIVAKKATTWGESGFPSEFLGPAVAAFARYLRSPGRRSGAGPVLGAINQQGAQVVGKALERALETGNSTPMGLIPLPVREVPATMAVPPSLMGYRVETARAADYDALLLAGRHE